MPDHNVDAIVQPFVQDVKQLYSDDLLSVELYGSAASGAYVPGRSNINVLVLLKEITPTQLKKSVKHIRRWRRQGGVVPLFLDPAYVGSSADVFRFES